MTRIALPALALVFATPAMAHPGHGEDATHWLTGDHLAMLLALAMLGVLATVIGLRHAARIALRDDDPRR